MDGGQSAVNSEIWGDLNQVSSDFNRSDGLSSVLLRATDASTVPALVNSMNDDRRLNVTAMTEKSYYDQQTVSAAPVQFLGIFISIIMAVGSSFAAMNTMYAAVARRARKSEPCACWAFARRDLVQLFSNRCCSRFLGGLIGCILVLPLNNITTGVGSFITFSEISFNFKVGPVNMMTGRLFAHFMGAIGGLVPARLAAKKAIITSLSEG